MFSNQTFKAFSGGEDEIRTRGTVIPYVSLANWWFQPLTHLSGNCIPSRDSLTDSPNRNANIKRNFGNTKFCSESVRFLFFSHACGIGLT